jgi:hypothetical protein
MASSLINFGPDLEPLQSEARREARFSGPRLDAIVGASEEVVAKLSEAQVSAAGWCELEQLLGDGEQRTIYVNAHRVRFVVDDEP